MSTSYATSSGHPYSLKVAQTQDEIEACYDVRMEVFVVEQGFPAEVEIDEYDPISTHFLLSVPTTSPPPESTASLTASSSDTSSTPKVIGTIRWTSSKAKLSRLVVLAEYRQYGFGRLLMEALHERVVETGYSEDMREVIEEKEGKRVVKIRLHSQIYAIPFYRKFGYISEGPEFDEDGAPHQRMVREIQLEPIDQAS